MPSVQLSLLPTQQRLNHQHVILHSRSQTMSRVRRPFRSVDFKRAFCTTTLHPTRGALEQVQGLSPGAFTSRLHPWYVEACALYTEWSPVLPEAWKHHRMIQLLPACCALGPESSGLRVGCGISFICFGSVQWFSV